MALSNASAILLVSSELDDVFSKLNTSIRLVLDNHSAHTSKETQRYLSSRPGRFEFVFTPKHSS